MWMTAEDGTDTQEDPTGFNDRGPCDPAFGFGVLSPVADNLVVKYSTVSTHLPPSRRDHDWHRVLSDKYIPQHS